MYPLQDAAIHGNRLFSGLLMYDYQKKRSRELLQFIAISSLVNIKAITP